MAAIAPLSRVLALRHVQAVRRAPLRCAHFAPSPIILPSPNAAFEMEIGPYKFIIHPLLSSSPGKSPHKSDTGKLSFRRRSSSLYERESAPATALQIVLQIHGIFIRVSASRLLRISPLTPVCRSLSGSVPPSVLLARSPRASRYAHRRHILLMHKAGFPRATQSYSTCTVHAHWSQYHHALKQSRLGQPRPPLHGPPAWASSTPGALPFMPACIPILILLWCS